MGASLQEKTVTTLMRAWEMAAKREIALDTSSYEYYVTILAQSLRFETAERLIGQMKIEFEFNLN